ncbi:hypothetical protein ACN38_g12510, partial [Penicillium nordicum]
MRLIPTVLDSHPSSTPPSRVLPPP